MEDELLLTAVVSKRIADVEAYGRVTVGALRVLMQNSEYRVLAETIEQYRGDIEAVSVTPHALSPERATVWIYLKESGEHSGLVRALTQAGFGAFSKAESSPWRRGLVATASTWVNIVVQGYVPPGCKVEVKKTVVTSEETAYRVVCRPGGGEDDA